MAEQVWQEEYFNFFNIFFLWGKKLDENILEHLLKENKTTQLWIFLFCVTQIVSTYIYWTTI